MAWTESTDGNKTIFTPGEGDAHPGLNKLIYDPDAPKEARVKAELSYFFAEDEARTESREGMRAKLGIR